MARKTYKKGKTNWKSKEKVTGNPIQFRSNFLGKLRWVGTRKGKNGTVVTELYSSKGSNKFKVTRYKTAEGFSRTLVTQSEVIRGNFRPSAKR